MNLDMMRMPSGNPISMNRYRLGSSHRVSMEEMDKWKDLLRCHEALYNAVEADNPTDE
jgi:hypothetical protein